jgi:hypothetical protein
MSASRKLESFDRTELIVDLFGPIIDVSKVPDFSEIANARYLAEEDIAARLRQVYTRDYGWRKEDILDRTYEILDNKKFNTQLIDRDVIKEICKAKKFGATVKIISHVPDEKLFSRAKKLIIKYTNFLSNSKVHGIETVLEDSDFLHLEGDPEKEGYKSYKAFIEEMDAAYSPENRPYRIVFTDNVDLDVPVGKGQEFPVKAWIIGMKNERYINELVNAIDDRKRAAEIETAIQLLAPSTQLNLRQFSIMDGFYVYNSDIREDLTRNISNIESIVKCSIGSSSPVCVFLLGAPGCGKSYFVKLFSKYIKAMEEFPEASLSGVSENSFSEAVCTHVRSVFDEATNLKANGKPRLAFLDEVDTKGGVLAFRLLMDAMTGTLTDDNGVDTKKKATNLIWIFAGSAESTKERFISSFRNDDRKVEDFFDRIHFCLELPTVDNPGQAILTFLSSLKKLILSDNKNLDDIKVSTGVLKLFGRTAWKSGRQITTVCRIAYANSCFSINNIRMENFEHIDVASAFKSAYNEMVENSIGDGEMIQINF